MFTYTDFELINHRCANLATAINALLAMIEREPEVQAALDGLLEAYRIANIERDEIISKK
jgi:hypothetical protein